jgi:methylenetetrahydrofolate reductase (NADPH)
MARIGTFSEHVVCPAEMLIPIRKDMPWPQAALTGCSVPTGVGAVTRAAKVEAGASVLITQLFFDNADYFRFVAALRADGIDVPVLPGIIPIQRVGQLDRMVELCGARVPPALRVELDARADDPGAAADFGVAYATAQCAELLAGGAPGLHFYTLNRSPATRAIVSALRAQGRWSTTAVA